MTCRFGGDIVFLPWLPSSVLLSLLIEAKFLWLC